MPSPFRGPGGESCGGIAEDCGAPARRILSGGACPGVRSYSPHGLSPGDVLAAMQLTGTAGAMQLANPRRGPEHGRRGHRQLRQHPRSRVLANCHPGQRTGCAAAVCPLSPQGKRASDELNGTTSGPAVSFASADQWKLSTVPAKAAVSPTGTRQALLVRRWRYLGPGDRVEVRSGDIFIGSGRVDEITADGANIWIYLDSGFGRVLIHKDDGVDLWRIASVQPARES